MTVCPNNAAGPANRPRPNNSASFTPKRSLPSIPVQAWGPANLSLTSFATTNRTNCIQLPSFKTPHSRPVLLNFVHWARLVDCNKPLDEDKTPTHHQRVFVRYSKMRQPSLSSTLESIMENRPPHGLPRVLRVRPPFPPVLWPLPRPAFAPDRACWPTEHGGQPCSCRSLAPCFHQPASHEITQIARNTS